MNDRDKRINPQNISLTLWHVNLIISLIFVIIYNVFFWKEIAFIIKPNTFKDYQLIGSLVLFLIFMINLILSLFTFRFSAKPILVTLFLLSAICLYFISQYNIVIDGEMVRNVIETNSSEAKDLLSLKLLFYVLFLGILPAYLVTRINIKNQTIWQLLTEKIKVLIITVMAVGLIVYTQYPSFASIARSNHHLSHMILPTNFIFGSFTYIKERFNQSSAPFNDISKNAFRGPNHEQKEVIVLIVGETARADRFSINGYQTETNPELKKRNLINFKQTSSCGTSTAVSLPCLFSHLNRKTYSQKEGKNTANLLDFLDEAGFDVQWRDNNTGCKGICKRIDYLDLANAQDEKLCSSGECYDEILIKGLREQILNNPNNQFIVLHQKGSHGPAYYLRYPQSFEKFNPTCENILLQNCTTEALNNTYNNTILYTDHFINETIKLLESLPESTSTQLVYISDHGESLGENNLYLHGTPYVIAPEAQTHVPFFYWNNHQTKSEMVDFACLQSKQNHPFSHDNVFHSMLGLSQVSTAYYKPELDIFESCMSKEPSNLTANITLE
ncbi:MAG: phosphoethanolamine--lipid A transferase [Xanthomonadales bacterium]|nr:phosphoethanolamine--lipid A transferase [Xanthomonadales bacterium]